MPHETQSNETTFGYLSIVHTSDHGYFGGYLIVSILGRPLEFHCTSPVQPSRAQEILYGPTLEPYLVGEQIGSTLLKAAKRTPQIVLTDRESMLSLRQQAGVPMARLVVAPDDESTCEHSELRLGGDAGDASVAPAARPFVPQARGQFSVGGYLFELPVGHEADEVAAAAAIGLIAPHVEPAEPFDRIHEAIREAQRIGGRTYEDHGQAA